MSPQGLRLNLLDAVLGQIRHRSADSVEGLVGGHAVEMCDGLVCQEASRRSVRAGPQSIPSSSNRDATVHVLDPLVWVERHDRVTLRWATNSLSADGTP